MNISDSPYGQGKNGLTGLRPYRHSLSLTTVIFYITKKRFINNNYYLIIKYLTPYHTLYHQTITASLLLLFFISYLTGILYLSPTAITSTVIFYITKKCFINNNT